MKARIETTTREGFTYFESVCSQVEAIIYPNVESTCNLFTRKVGSVEKSINVDFAVVTDHETVGLWRSIAASDMHVHSDETIFDAAF